MPSDPLTRDEALVMEPLTPEQVAVCRTLVEAGDWITVARYPARLILTVEALTARAERAEAQLAAARTVIRHHICGAVRLSHIDRGVEWVYPDGATAPITPAEVAEIHAATNQSGEPT